MAQDQINNDSDKGDRNAAVRHIEKSYIKSTDPNCALLNGEIEILYQRRLPHLDKGIVKAYAAQNKGEAGKQSYFAMICEPHLVPRIQNISGYSAVGNASLVKLISSGIVYWQPAQAWRFCLVFENTLGNPLMKSMEEEGLGWRPDHVMTAVIKPMIGMLMDMRDAGVVHGNIRPTNMFDDGKKPVERVVLGECLSTPSGLTQPALFEPVERAMCSPIGKGRGTLEDDIYSFGVTLACILRKKDPLAGKTDEEIIAEKIEIGSYAALTGQERFTGGMLELLRGLLYDDPGQRWTINEIMTWLDGQRLSPKQTARKKKAARPLLFCGERYFRTSLLARDLNKNQSEAVQMIDTGNLDQWIARSLEDSAVKARVDQAIEAAQEYGRGPGYWDRLLSRVCVALDPESPLQFRGLKIHPEGLPAAMAEAFILKKDIQSFVDIINQQLVMFWLNAQTDTRADIGALASRYESCRAFLRQANLGYGVERCLYYINPDMPCISEKLHNYYVRSPEDLLFALEEIARAGKRSDLFIDRHVAAFLSVRDRKVIDNFWPDLIASEYHRRIMGNIKTLATIQKRSRLGSFPELSRWVSELLEPVYEKYHDRELREFLKKKMQKLKDGGDLTKIVALLDDHETLQRDFNGFKNAMLEYSDLSEESQDLQIKMQRPDTIGRKEGGDMAALISCILGAIFVMAFSFIYFSDRGLF